MSQRKRDWNNFEDTPNWDPQRLNKPGKEYYHSEEWKDMRQDRLNDESCCEICGSKKNLVLHHLTYERVSGKAHYL